MPEQDSVRAAIRIGQQNLDEVLARRAAAQKTRAKALASHPRAQDVRLQSGGAFGVAPSITAGFLVAAGDSWFDYPIHDVLKKLDEEHGYDIESAAHRGDPVEAMASENGQLDKLARCFEKVAARGGNPKAVLLSGGGDDIAGKEFGMLLNNRTLPIGGWNAQVVSGVLNQRITVAYQKMFWVATQMGMRYTGKKLPILIHGYDYPVPDGRGFWGGWPFPGPWLQPGFREKLFEDLNTTVTMMHQVMDQFNDTMIALTKFPELGDVRYVDLRGTLSNDLKSDKYKQWWANELHPTEDGFSAIANRFASTLSAL